MIVRLTRTQLGLLALEDAPPVGIQIIRVCGYDVWLEGSLGAFESLSRLFQDFADHRGHGAQKRTTAYRASRWIRLAFREAMRASKVP